MAFFSIFLLFLRIILHSSGVIEDPSFKGEILEENNIIGYDKSSLHKVDNKTYNVTWDYTFDVCASTRIAQKIFAGFKPCVDEYLETFSTLGRRKYLVYDCKLKKIPEAGGFHNWNY